MILFDITNESPVKSCLVFRRPGAARDIDALQHAVVLLGCATCASMATGPPLGSTFSTVSSTSLSRPWEYAAPSCQFLPLSVQWSSRSYAGRGVIGVPLEP